MFGNHHSVALVLINLLGLAGIVVWYFQGRGRPMARLIVQILFFASMTAVLWLSGILPHWMAETDLQGAYLAKSARILWWIHLAWTLVGFVRLYIVVEHRPREARLLQELVVAVIYLGVALSITGFVFGVPVATLAATSGVVAIIVGLALQNTLGDVFSGIALTLGRPYTLGDWIMLGDGTEGRIVRNNLALHVSAYRCVQHCRPAQQRVGETQPDQSKPSRREAADQRERADCQDAGTACHRGNHARGPPKLRADRQGPGTACRAQGYRRGCNRGGPVLLRGRSGRPVACEE